MEFFYNYFAPTTTTDSPSSNEQQQQQTSSNYRTVTVGVSIPSSILPPWQDDIPPQWLGREEELKQFIMDLSKSEFTFRVPREKQILSDDDDLFHFDLREDHDFYRACLMLQLDNTKLAHMRSELVGGHCIDENSFWSSYFYFIHVIKETKSIHKLPKVLRDLHRRASEFCVDKSNYSEIIREIQWTVQTIEQCLVLVDELWLRNRDEIKEKDLTHLDDCVIECIERKQRIFELSSSDAPHTEEEKEKLDESMIEFTTMFQKLMSHYDKFKKSLMATAELFNPPLINATRDPPSVTTKEQRIKICSALPIRFHRSPWTLVYSTLEHGISIATLLRLADNAGETLTIVQTTKGAIFGAYNGESYTKSGKYYGTGETFVFSFANLDPKTKQPIFKVFHWSKKNDYFVRSTEFSGIIFGGGNDGKSALFIEPNLESGTTRPCQTFDSTCLNRDPTKSTEAAPSEDDEEFHIYAVEIWAFGTTQQLHDISKNGPVSVLSRFSV
jgi:hypothetical protein